MLPAVCVGALALHFGAREAVASAVALAPNATKGDGLAVPMTIPEALAARGARSLHIRADKPAATIASWVVEPRALPEKATVVLLHGVRMDKQSLAPLAVALSDAGYRTVLVDLRGHGESSGRYLTYGSVEANDLALLLDALGIKTHDRLGVYGFSYGAAVAIGLSARDSRVDAVVAVASFASLREVTLDYEQKYLPPPLTLVPDSWFQRAVDEAGRIAAFDPDRAAPVSVIESSSAHLLLIHGDADTQVPLRHAQALATAAGARAELRIVRGATHDSMPSDSTGAVRRETVAWFDRWLVDSPGAEE